MSIADDREDFATFEPTPAAPSIVDRMKALMAAGAVPTAPASPEANNEEAPAVENPAPFGLLTVHVPKFRLFWDGHGTNETRRMFTEAVGFDSQPRPRTAAEAAKDIKDVIDETRAVYVDSSGQPIPSPFLASPAETFSGDDWRSADSGSALTPRHASKMTPGGSVEQRSGYVSLTQRGGVNGRKTRVMRWDGSEDWQ
jgi:hypothetical protein